MDVKSPAFPKAKEVAYAKAKERADLKVALMPALALEYDLSYEFPEIPLIVARFYRSAFDGKRALQMHDFDVEITMELVEDDRETMRLFRLDPEDRRAILFLASRDNGHRVLSDIAEEHLDMQSVDWLEGQGFVIRYSYEHYEFTDLTNAGRTLAHELVGEVA